MLIGYSSHRTLVHPASNALTSYAVHRLPGTLSWPAPASPSRFSSGVHEVFLGSIKPSIYTSVSHPPPPPGPQTPGSHSSSDRCMLSPCCRLRHTQCSCPLGAVVPIRKLDVGTEGRIPTSLPCVSPAPGSVRHMVDPVAVQLLPDWWREEWVLV